MTTIIFILMLLGFLLMLRRLRGDGPGTYDAPMVLLLVYLFVEYARPQSMYPELDIVPWAKVTMAVLLGCLFLRVRSGTIQHFLGRRQDTLLFTYVGIAAISIFTGIDGWNAGEAFILLLKLVVFYLVLTRVVDTPARLSAFIWTLILINLKLAQHHIRAFLSQGSHIGIELAIRRGANSGIGFLGNSGDFGVAMCVVLPLAFFAIWWERHRLMKCFAVVSVVTFMVAVYSTGTRGGFLGVLAIGASILLKMPRKTPALLSAIGIGVICFSLAPDAYWRRMATILETSGTADIRTDGDYFNKITRLELWKAGLRMVTDYPLAGVGIGNFTVALGHDHAGRVDVSGRGLEDRAARYFVGQLSGQGVLVSHNMFMQALSELGVAGLALIFLSFFAGFRRHGVIRSTSADSQHESRFTFYLSHGLDVSLVGLAVSGSFLSVLYYPHLWLLLGLSVAVTNVALTKTREARKLESNREDQGTVWLEARQGHGD